MIRRKVENEDGESEAGRYALATKYDALRRWGEL
jgi:hypothetical protein